MRVIIACSFFAKDDPGLGQIVRGKLHFHLVAGNDSDEMLAHFARNMGQNITRTRQVHPEHCPRQHLCHRSFRDDLFFFRHAIMIGKERGVLNCPASVGSKCKRKCAYGRTVTAVPIFAAS